MSNPLPNEAKIYEQIKNEGIKVHPLVWDLIEHHVGNDVHIINLIMGFHVSSDSRELSGEDAQKILDQCGKIWKFLKNLQDLTKGMPAKG